MSTATIRIITGAVLILHGIGHAMALVPALNIFSTDAWNTRSWLLTGGIGLQFAQPRSSGRLAALGFGTSSTWSERG